MKGNIRKTATACIIMVCLLLISGFILTWSGITIHHSVSSDRQSFKAACVADLFNNIEKETESVDSFLKQNLDSDTRLMTDAMRSFVRDGKYTGPLLGDDYCVAEIKGDRIILPEGVPAGLEKVTPDMILDEQELPMSERTPLTVRLDKADDQAVNVILSCGMIYGDYCYIKWTTQEKIDEYIDKYFDLEDILNIAENSFKECILLVDTSSEDLKLINHPDEYPEAETAGDIGFSRKMISEEVKEFRDKKNRLYDCSYKKLVSEPYTVIVLSPAVSGINAQYTLLSFLVTGLMMVLCIITIVWLDSIKSFIREHVITESEKKRYHPVRVRSLFILSGIFGAALVFICASFFHAIGTLRSVTQSNIDSMDILLTRLEQNEKIRESESYKEEEQWLVHYGQQIVSLLADNPGLAAKEQLQNFCEDLDADYMMIFDQQGKESLCSTTYSGFTLDMFNQDDKADFSLLLKGVPSIVRDPVMNKTTGLVSQIVGVTIPVGGDSANNGALIMAFSPERTKRTLVDDTVSEELSLLVPEGELCFAINEKSEKVSFCSNASLTGMTADEIGIKKKNLKDRFMDFFQVLRVNYYGTSSRKNGDRLYYYARQTTDMLKSVFYYGLTTIPLFLAVYYILLIYLLKDYDITFFEEKAAEGTSLINDPVLEVRSDDGKLHRTIDPSKRFVFSYHKWKDMRPEEKAWFAGRVIMLTYLFVGLVWTTILSHHYTDSNILGFILYGDWTRGWNLFAICAVFIVLYIAFAVVTLSRLILQAICSYTGTRGETLCRLIYNFIEYISVFMAAYYIFEYLGYDTGAVIASLGLVTLALSLGAKDMVADILAGISIIFEEDFQVGDIVEIDGYRGMIQEVGVRSTKIIGQGNNIKIINNRDIKSIINMTRLNSWYAIDMNISAAESLERVEKILDEQLKRIGAKEKTIISGPFYKGVTALGNGVATITIIAECKEQDYNHVRRYINRELRLLFNRENIKM